MIQLETVRDLRILWIVPIGILVPIVAVMGATPGGFNRMLNSRAVEQQVGETTVYRIKPIARLPLLVVLLVNFAWISMEVSIHGLSRWIELVVLVLFTTCFVMIGALPYKILLDEEGVPQLPADTPSHDPMD